MEEATNPELADLIERSSLNTPAARALQDLAYDDDIAAVFDRAGYRPPTAAAPPARSVDQVVGSRSATDANANTFGNGELSDLPMSDPSKTLLRLTWPDHDQTYPTGSHRHKTVVDVVAALSDACAAPQRRPLWSRIWKTGSKRRHLEASVEAEAAYATLLSRLLTHYLDETSTWADTHRVPSMTTIRSVVYVFVDESGRREDPSLSAKHALEQLRNAIVHGMHGDAGFDIVRAETDAFVCQIKNYSRRPVRNLAIKIPLPMAALWVIRPTPDSPPSVVLSRPDDDHWIGKPIRAINIDVPGSLAPCQ